jgi:hypothetical protein
MLEEEQSISISPGELFAMINSPKKMQMFFVDLLVFQFLSQNGHLNLKILQFYLIDGVFPPHIQ